MEQYNFKTQHKKLAQCKSVVFVGSLIGVFFLFMLHLENVYGIDRPSKVAALVPIIDLLLSDEESEIVVLQSNHGYALIGAKHRLVFVKQGVEQEHIEARLVTPNPYIKSYYGGIVEYELPRFSEAGTEVYTFDVKDRSNNTRSQVDVEITVIPTEIVAQGSIGPQGGQLYDGWQDYVLTIPEGAVEAAAEISLLRGALPSGEFIYQPASSQPLLKLGELRTPKLTTITSLNDLANFKSNLTSSVWKRNHAKQVVIDNLFYTASFVFDDTETFLGDKAAALVLRNLVSSDNDSLVAAHPSIIVSPYEESSRLVSHCGIRESYVAVCGQTQAPVLLVHGLQREGFGDTSYWGTLASDLREEGYPVFEFQWRSDTTFKRTADELGDAINRINTNTNMKLNIVAHSFGGLLARTYLQNFAENISYSGGVRSLVTIGTPHSGIFDSNGATVNEKINEESGTKETRIYPRGQDNPVIIKLCNQFSCHQAGQPTPDAFSYPDMGPLSGCELPDSSVSTPSVCLLTETESPETQPQDFGVDEQHGMAIHRIHTNDPDHQLNVPALALMSMNIKRDEDTNCHEPRIEDEYGAGDLLISFAGQRFSYASGDSPILTRTTLNPINSSPISEHLLGVTNQGAVPGAQTSSEDTFQYDSFGNCTPDTFKGYAHSSSVAKGRDTQTNIVFGKRNILSDIPHDTFVQLMDWLSLYPSTEHTPETIEIIAYIKDSSTGERVEGAQFTVFDGAVEIGSAISDHIGLVLLDVPFYEGARYHFSVSAENYHQYDDGAELTLETSTSTFQLGSIPIHPDTLVAGGVDISVIHANDKYTVAGVDYVVERNTVKWRGTTSAEGIISLPELIRGNYNITLSKAGYKTIANRVSVNHEEGESLSVEIIPLAKRNVVRFGRPEEPLDMTKLDSNGSELLNDAAVWSCVRDNRTGLVWENKTNDGGVHDQSNQYRWGGYTAVNRAVTPRFGAYEDDWNILITASNDNFFCGVDDWRIPSRREFRSIVDYHLYDPALSVSYFPNLPTSAAGMRYWTNLPHATDSGSAWVIGFLSGLGGTRPRAESGSVRLVSGGIEE